MSKIRMQQENGISARNMGSLITLNILSITLLGGASTSEQDTWIAVLGAAVIAAPLLLVYARLAKLLPGMSLFDMIAQLFGRVGSAIVSVLFSFYAILVCAIALNSVSEFTFVIDLEKTPRIVIMALLLAVALYLSRSGFRLMGRWSLIACSIVIASLAFTIILAFYELDFGNLRPVLNHSLGVIASDMLLFGTGAFGETVLVLAAFGTLKKGANPYKAYLGALLVGSSSLVLIVLRNITLLGVPMFNTAIFPSYIATRIVYLGNFLDHIESLISISIILISLTKIALCLSAASMGMANTLRLKDHRKPLVPIAVAVLILTATVFDSVQQLLEFLKIYPFIALPFVALLPIALWIAAEINARKQNTGQQMA